MCIRDSHSELSKQSNRASRARSVCLATIHMSSLAGLAPTVRIGASRSVSRARDERGSRSIRPRATASDPSKDKERDAPNTSSSTSRRSALLGAASLAAVAPASVVLASSEDVTTPLNPRAYFQRYPTLFAPFYGDDERATLLKTVVPDRVWCLEQNLAVGPLETPLRCVVIRLKDDSLWVHAPLAPTAEFFQLIEGLGTVKHLSLIHI